MNDTDNHPSRERTRRPWEFLAVFLIIFFIVSVFLYAIDFVPEAPAGDDASVPVATANNAAVPAEPEPMFQVEAPMKVVIASIGVDTPVENPATTDLKALDEELLKGAVRYPGSAALGEQGTVYLFGHQSYLPVVKNKAFKAFNDVQKLKEGDTITVSSATAEYTYQVKKVSLKNAADGVVELPRDGYRLVLSTCNSISANHEERYVVEAELVSRRALDS